MCSVYYDSFVTAVSSINSNIHVFSSRDFLKEFDKNIMYGFHFAVDIHTCLYKQALDNFEDKGKPSEDKYVKYVTALVRDIVQFKINMKYSV